MKLFLLLFFIQLSFAQVLETDGDKYFLSGKCEALKKEIEYFSKESVECICDEELCKVEIKKHLPPRIQEMLEIKNTIVDGPNCWNSVLFSLGANQTLRFSQNEMDYWMKSPLCKKREGKPLPGDLVNLSYLYEDSTTLLAHTYQVLSPNIAFNKTSPNKNHPYEIIQQDEYFNRYLFPESCQFVGKSSAKDNKCEIIAEAYTCQNLDQALLSLDKKIQDDLQHLGECAQKGSLGESLPWDDFLEMSKAIQKLALDKLKVPDTHSTPKEIQELLGQHADNQGDWTEYIPSIYFYASPEMKIDEFPVLLKKAIEIAREKKLYADLTLEDKLMWTNVYLTGESLHGQFEILKYE